MATYKVIQDIEAEDKLVGPLTLRQFIYASVSVVCMYICFLGYTKGATFLLGFFLPIAAVSGFFAFPWRGEQPTEIWALARLRFALKPRVRIWDQDGAKDMVTITAPKKLSDPRPVRNLTQNEVRSRLRALADTIDSRGWATRNAAYAPYGQNWIHQTVAPAVPNNGGLAVSMPSDDMFDSQNSVAQNFDALLTKSSQQNRERALQYMNNAQNPQAAAPQQAVYQSGATYQATPYQQGSFPSFQPGQVPTLPAPVMPASYQQYQPPAAPQQQVYGQPVLQMAGQVIGAPGAGVAGVAPAPAENLWFANGPAYPAGPAAAQAAVAPVQPMQTVAPTARIESDVPLPEAAAVTDEDAAMGAAIKERNSAVTVNYGHMKVLQPIGSQADYPAPADDQADGPLVTPMTTPAAAAPAAAPAPAPVAEPAAAAPAPQAPPPKPAILELANNDDLDIATIARQAKKEIQKAPDEVEIRLH